MRSRFIILFWGLMAGGNALIAQSLELVRADRMAEAWPAWQASSELMLRSGSGHLAVQVPAGEAPLSLQQSHLLKNGDDFIMEADLVATSEGIDSRWGLFWGGDRHGRLQHRLWVRADGSFCVESATTEGIKTLLPWTKHRLLKPSGGSLTLRIEKKGWRIYLSINEKPFGELSAPSLKGKYHGFVFQGPGQYKVSAVRWWCPPEAIQLAGGRFELARRLRQDSTVNDTILDETAPRLSPNLQSLYFTRSHPNQPGTGQVWVSHVQGDTMWSLPQAVFSPPLPGRTEVMEVTPDHLRLVRMHTQGPAGLAVSDWADSLWQAPRLLPLMNMPAVRGALGAFESEDGQLMILSAELPGGYGGQDLYLLNRQPDGTWSAPRNLGPELNTFEDEFAPWLDPDGVTLYFTSGGHPGYGGWDLFRSQRLTQTWTKWTTPANLGPRVNSPFDEGWWYPDRDGHAYFSAKDSGRNDFDLMGLYLPADPRTQPLANVRVQIRQRETGETMTGQVVIRSITGEPWVREWTVTSAGESFLVPLGEGYQIYASVPGYFSVTDTLDLRAVKRYRDMDKGLDVLPVEVGATIRLDHVYFERATDVLLPESHAELDRLLALLQGIPALGIEIQGHTDDIGDPMVLQQLSEDRARRVKAYLTERGIEESRMIARGFGSTRPVADNRNPATRPLNRRVEFVILRR